VGYYSFALGQENGTAERTNSFAAQHLVVLCWAAQPSQVARTLVRETNEKVRTEVRTTIALSSANGTKLRGCKLVQRRFCLVQRKRKRRGLFAHAVPDFKPTSC